MKTITLTFTYELDEQEFDDDRLVEQAADLLAEWLQDGNVPEVGVNAFLSESEVTA